METNLTHHVIFVYAYHSFASGQGKCIRDIWYFPFSEKKKLNVSNKTPLVHRITGAHIKSNSTCHGISFISELQRKC